MEFVVCDGDMSAATRLVQLLHVHGTGNDQIYVFSRAIDLEVHIENKKDVDAVFMDVMLDEENGIVLAHKIQKKFPEIQIVFMSGHIHKAKDIFTIRPTFFLVKPFDETKVEEAVNRIKEEKTKSVIQSILVSNKGTIMRLPFEQILYVENKTRTAMVVTKDVTYVVNKKLDALMSNFDGRFVRCHQSYIVNLEHVKAMNHEMCVLLNGATVPISQSRRSISKKQFIHFLEK